MIPVVKYGQGLDTYAGHIHAQDTEQLQGRRGSSYRSPKCLSTYFLLGIIQGLVHSLPETEMSLSHLQLYPTTQHVLD